jgi:hypothetical protein
MQNTKFRIIPLFIASFCNRLSKVYKEPCGRFFINKKNQNGFQKKLSIAPARRV